MSYRGIIDRYRDLLPVEDHEEIVTLCEGNTPLVPAPRLGASLGIELYLKYEGCNPTGSFKDRGMTLAVTKAKAAGARAIVCASTGNTSASSAAYGVRAGLASYVVVPAGKVALGKMAQALAYGSKIIEIEGNFDQGLEMVRRLSEKHPEIALVNSVNPYRIEGQTTGAYELCDALGDAPDILAIPVGNAGNITAYWRGFNRYRERGRSRSVPKMWGFQAAGAAPLVEGRPIEQPETIATAIRIGKPASWHMAVAAVRDSSGRVAAVTDAEILDAYHRLASEEGVFCEPASAAPVAGLIKAKAEGALPQGARVVAILTGHGLKDPQHAIPPAYDSVRVQPELPALEEAVMAGVTRGA